MLLNPLIRSLLLAGLLLSDPARGQDAGAASSPAEGVVSVPRPISPGPARSAGDDGIKAAFSEALTSPDPAPEASLREEVPAPPPAVPLSKPVPEWTNKRVSILGIDRTAFPEMLVVFSLRNARGEPVLDLAPDDLVVTEDEAPQTLTDLDACVPERIPGEPLNLVLLIDSSGSMQPHLDVVVNAAARFVDRFHRDDAAGVVAFCNQPVPLCEITDNHKKIQKSIYRIVPRGFTALYDSTSLALRLLAACSFEGKRAVVLLTDGRDDDGTGAPLSRATLDSVIEAANRWNIPIFTLGLGQGISQTVLTRMAEETGGEFLYAPTGDEVESLYDEVARELGRGDEGFFKINYIATRSQKDGSDRTIVIRHKEHGLDMAQYEAPRNLFWPLSQVIR